VVLPISLDLSGALPRGKTLPQAPSLKTSKESPPKAHLVQRKVSLSINQWCYLLGDNNLAKSAFMRVSGSGTPACAPKFGQTHRSAPTNESSRFSSGGVELDSLLDH
jgi:hypothetical protein